ncbi:hypothetical protein VB796_11170 [Arcicella sp. LKC2W]|uniref:hypothetical protein n=1 Tax=Arcicella sp. LKC2W TaxID=2984198 RepID=UPI002B211721|nr:hypothetical protein [Arcicella sp. LKC2W]MEA5459606.1 hypothetical protein [Arcicella sp. LKC2W]
MKDEDIFDILDGIASEETMRQHHKMLVENAEYQAIFNEYAQTHALLMDVSIEKTAVDFTDKLIDRWEVSQEVVNVRKTSKLPFYFLILMTISLVCLFIAALPMLNSQAVQVDLSKPLRILQDKDFTRLFLIINALVVLFFIDKRVLKPYFQRKMGV